MNDISIGVVGNPNCGKTTLFNALTGARQKIGNWPGVTVDKKAGRYHRDGTAIEVVDLPGVYSLGFVPGMDNIDEKIGRDFILSGGADLIVNIVDASNLERNLYLTAQLLEMRVPMVVALNMMDTARRLGLDIDCDELSQRLGCPVLPVVASEGEGIDALRAAIDEVAASGHPPSGRPTYSASLESAIEALAAELAGTAEARGTDARWLAVKLLEDDPAAREAVTPEALALAEDFTPTLEAELNEEPDLLIADGRYGYVNGLVAESVQVRHRVKRSRSDAVDRIVLNEWIGLPVFLAIMYAMFTFTINIGGAFIDFFDMAAAAVFVDGVKSILEVLGAPLWITVMLADGLGGGIQVVATFIPIIGFLYLFLSVLEDSGYMARAAFLMDRYMRMIGLPGKSFVPLIVGFGCNVPAIMASRTLDNQRDRTMSVLMAPFMSCGARLAVYALFVAAFFPEGGQNIVFLLYLVGVAVAILTGFFLKHTLLTGETGHFVMELPRYHLPRPRSVLINAWNRLKSFMFGAGKVIVVVVMALAFLNSWGTDGSFGNEDSDKSVLSAIGRAIVPAFTPLGIDDDNWPATVGIFTGIFAKEAVVGTLDALYSSLAETTGDGTDVGEAEAFDLWAALADATATVPENLSGLGSLLTDPLDVAGASEDAAEVSAGTFGAMVSRFDGGVGAIAYMLFILLYTPCVAALGAVIREIGPRWGTFAALWTTFMAYAVSIGVYQAGTFARHPATSAAWLAGVALSLAAAFLVMRQMGHRAGTGTHVGSGHLPPARSAAE